MNQHEPVTDAILNSIVEGNLWKQLSELKTAVDDGKPFVIDEMTFPVNKYSRGRLDGLFIQNGQVFDKLNNPPPPPPMNRSETDPEQSLLGNGGLNTGSRRWGGGKSGRRKSSYRRKSGRKSYRKTAYRKRR